MFLVKLVLLIMRVTLATVATILVSLITALPIMVGLESGEFVATEDGTATLEVETAVVSTTNHFFVHKISFINHARIPLEKYFSLIMRATLSIVAAKLVSSSAVLSSVVGL